jgi:hypothetical protein
MSLFVSASLIGGAVAYDSDLHPRTLHARRSPRGNTLKLADYDQLLQWFVTYLVVE